MADNMMLLTQPGCHHCLVAATIVWSDVWSEPSNRLNCFTLFYRALADLSVASLLIQQIKRNMIFFVSYQKSCSTLHFSKTEMKLCSILYSRTQNHCNFTGPRVMCGPPMMAPVQVLLPSLPTLSGQFALCGGGSPCPHKDQHLAF